MKVRIPVTPMVAVVAALTVVATPPAIAGAQFHATLDAMDVAYCADNVTTGRFAPTNAQYQSQGSCAAYHVPARQDDSTHSTFPDPQAGTLLFQADWTAQGGYDYTTHMAQETITLPAPTLDQNVPAGRPYGRFTSSMLCMTDPWLDNLASCTSPKTGATGNLGLLQQQLGQLKRPLSATLKPEQRQALVDQHQQRLAALTSATSRPMEPVRVIGAKPTVVAPLAGATQRPGLPLVVRVAAPPVKASTYQFEVQRKDASGNWSAVTTLPVAGAAVEATTGTALWGAPNAVSPQNEPLGSYRLRASADGGPPSDWREFAVAGPPALSAQGPNPWQVVQPAASSGTPPNFATPASALSRTQTVPPRPVPNWGQAPSALGH